LRGKIDSFRFLGFFGKKIKSFRKESVLIFHQKSREEGVLSTFKFFSITPCGGPGPPPPLISENSVFLLSS
jgi:hypothetical protein